MGWRFESGLSLSVQIVDKLRSDIIGGKYESGMPFPTVRQLAEEAAVNPNTMQKALCALEAEGLLVTRSTNGREVTSDLEVIAAAREKVTLSNIKKVIKVARELDLDKDELIEYIKKGWDGNEEDYCMCACVTFALDSLPCAD